MSVNLENIKYAQIEGKIRGTPKFILILYEKKKNSKSLIMY